MSNDETNGPNDRGNESPSERAIASKLSAFLENAFDSMALTRRNHYLHNPHERPTPADVDRIIASTANQNAIIAGACAMAPGPWGALTIVPEMIAVIRNQIQMVYDLGVAYGKEAHLNGPLLLAIFATATGGGAISLATVKGGQLVVKRASLRVLQRVIAWLGGKITQRALRAFLSRWVPFVGAAAMALWARQSTVAIGRKAADLLRREISFEGHAPE